MNLKFCAHLSVLFKTSAFIFLALYLFLHQKFSYFIILTVSFFLSELFIRLFLQIQIVHDDQSRL